MGNGSYEDRLKHTPQEEKTQRLDLSTLRFFWQVSPLSGTGDQLIPKFLRNLKIFKEFTNNELRILSKFLHVRSFSPQETIFLQDDIGFGFYLILSGNIDIFARIDFKKETNGSEPSQLIQNDSGDHLILLASLERNEYFGELALLEENSIRSATALSKNNATLLGIFKPDIAEIINQYPIVGAKFLQSISVILANRLASVNQEMKSLKSKLENQQKK